MIQAIDWTCRILIWTLRIVQTGTGAGSRHGDVVCGRGGVCIGIGTVTDQGAGEDLTGAWCE